MARIELRDATIYLQDGLSGTGALNDAGGLSGGELNLDIDTIVLNSTDTDLVPVGARFTIVGEATAVIHTVTARTPTSSSPTTNIVFTPAIAAASTIADNAVITFLPQRVAIKIGDGNLTWTRNKEYNYELDRGNLDTVREGDQIPMDVTIDFTYEHIRTGTGEVITPDDALNQEGGAAEWVSSATDACEPYAVDILIDHATPCGSAEDELTTLPDYRYESLNHDLDAATISSSGRCNAVAPTVARS